MNAEEALKTGFRPCKRCRPDLQLKTYEPLKAIIDDTMQIINSHYDQKMLMNELASMVGVSRFHLNRLFKDSTGDTPRIYLEKVRIKKAKELLLTTSLNSTEVGYQIGYQSISSFYNAFKRSTGLSPIQFQNQYVKSPTT
ncbi:helix-turn-helix domain-containing protein [Virgibacillus salexigens]|uniref:helix-turn-helix domain-containing protein n=1 Tax=Virgibacillus salexigens TaxID=61016 RepID=UPI00190B9D49|nr:helix-turn-helix domain-containing protein [Virgibacillus salexigens]